MTTNCEEQAIMNDLLHQVLITMLKPKDGIVIKVTDELKKTFPFEQAIVFNNDGKITILEESAGWLEGQRLYMH